MASYQNHLDDSSSEEENSTVRNNILEFIQTKLISSAQQQQQQQASKKKVVIPKRKRAQNTIGNPEFEEKVLSILSNFEDFKISNATTPADSEDDEAINYYVNGNDDSYMGTTDEDSETDETPTKEKVLDLAKIASLLNINLDQFRNETESKKTETPTKEKELDLAKIASLLNINLDQFRNETESKKTKTRSFICKFCNAEVDIYNNDFNKALSEHRVTAFHQAAEKRMKERREQSKRGNRPKIIRRDDDKIAHCTICDEKIGKSKKTVLLHCQGLRHKKILKARFGKEPEKSEESKPEVKKKPPPRRAQSTSRIPKEKPKKEEISAEDLKKRMECIQPISNNQLSCTLCAKKLPIMTDYASLLKVITDHVQGAPHVMKLSEKEVEKIKKTVPNRIDKETLKDGTYRFVCLLCDFDGYGYKYCKFHMNSEDHHKRVRLTIGNGSGIATNFTDGVECEKCSKRIFGTLIGIAGHVETCQVEVVPKPSKRSASVPRGPRNRPPPLMEINSKLLL